MKVSTTTTIDLTRSTTTKVLAAAKVAELLAKAGVIDAAIFLEKN